MNCCYNVANSNIKVKFAAVENVILIERYSSLIKLLRVTALVRKIILIWRHKAENRNIGKRTRSHVDSKNTLSIDALDIQKAKHLWILAAQCIVRDYKNFSQLRYQLNLLEDEFGLIRCNSRLKSSDLDNNQKYPCLLPKEHIFTKLNVLHAHFINLESTKI